MKKMYGSPLTFTYVDRYEKYTRRTVLNTRRYTKDNIEYVSGYCTLRGDQRTFFAHKMSEVYTDINPLSLNIPKKALHLQIVFGIIVSCFAVCKLLPYPTGSTPAHPQGEIKQHHKYKSTTLNTRIKHLPLDSLMDYSTNVAKTVYNNHIPVPEDKNKKCVFKIKIYPSGVTKDVIYQSGERDYCHKFINTTWHSKFPKPPTAWRKHMEYTGIVVTFSDG